MPQPQRRHEQALQPPVLPEQPQELPVDVPPTEPELHPQRRQPQLHEELEFEELPLLLPPTEPEELLQVQVQVQRLEGLEPLVPATEPEDWFRQQGLQQELATKLGNTMPP